MRKSHKHIEEEELLQRYFSSQDPKWLGFLLEGYTALLFGVAMKYLKEENTAKDIVQQVHLKALIEIPKREIQNIGGWLYQVTKNECFNHFRNKKVFHDEDILDQLPENESSSLSDLMFEEDKRKELLQVINELKAEQKDCLEAFYFQQMSYQQIAEKLSLPVKQVKSNIQNGKRNLKIKLTESKPDLFK